MKLMDSLSNGGFNSFSRAVRRPVAVWWTVAGILLGVGIFVSIAIAVQSGRTEQFDRQLLLSMRHSGSLLPKGSPAFQESARDVTALGGSLVLGFVTAATAGFLVLSGKRRMAGFLCTSITLGWIVAALLKDLFERPRPDIVPHAMYVATASFPSGHSMRSAIVYLTLGVLLARAHDRTSLKAYFLFLAISLTLVIGVSRVYLGVHWPTDVLAGWTAGAVWASLCSLAARAFKAIE